MRESLRLGRIAGINVGVNWSVLVVFALITFGLAAGRFPLLYPDLPPAAYLVAGLVAGIVFFVSLLAHEISHAVTARRHGVEAEGITLWLFGGVARLTGEAPHPRAELQISAVGPLTSLVLAAVFFAVRWVIHAAGGSGLTVGVFDWLAVINAVLAVFNLVPAAPLDGGRILRAFLWHRRGDRTSAAVTAARAGRAFGWFLVALGLAGFILAAGLGGLWFALIGWFLINAAGAEEQHALTTAALGDVRVGDVMSRDPATAPADVTVEALLEDYVFPNRYSSFPLTEDSGRPTGLVTLNRVKQVRRDERSTTPVREIACPLSDLPVVNPDEPLARLLPKMRACADGRALVVEGDRLVGIVSPSDVVRQLEMSELRDRFERV